MLGIFIVLMIIIASLAVPVVIVVAIVSAVKKSKEGKKEESVGSVIKTIYLYILLVVFLCMVIGGVLGTVDYGLDAFLPVEEFENTVVGQNDKHEAINGMVASLATFGISLPMFIYHNKIVKQLKDKEV